MKIFCLAPFLIAFCASCAGGKAAGGGGGAVAEEGGDPRNLSRFLKQHDVTSIEISPQGTTLAAMSTISGETHVTFFDTKTLKSVGGFRVSGNSLFSRIAWADETRLVAQLAENYGGLTIPVSYGELYAVNSDGTDEKVIFGYRAKGAKTGTSIITHDVIYAWGSIIDRMPKDPRNMLVMARFWPEGVEPGAVEAYSVDAYTGRRAKVAAGPGQVSEYYTDENKQIRLALSVARDASLEAYWYEDRDWKRLDRVLPQLKTGRPIGFSATQRKLYLVDEDEKGPALFVVSLDSGERSVLVREPGVEPADVLFDAKTGVPVAVQFVPDEVKWKILDGAHPLSKILKLSVEKLGSLPRVISTTEDQQQAVVLSVNSDAPAIYSLVRADGFVQPLLPVREESGAPAITQAFKLKASDGLEIRGYVTTPKDAKGPLPMVVLPHGGPHGIRDFGYDDDAQLFAAFGFATLRVNFRGSGGYGESFVRAGYLRWGDRVQDDIIEATKWAIAQKIADEKKISIFGASFGGYSALQSTIRAPGLFRCAVGYAGIYDLSRLFEEGDIQQTERGFNAIKKYVGTDRETLKKNSPAENAERINVPVLLLHGEKDQRAPISHAKALCEAMHAKKGHCEEHYVENEMHGFFELNNRVAAYSRALAFIEKYGK